jgi:hypothetical protein
MSAMSDLDTAVRDLAKAHHREARDDIDRYDILAMVGVPILYAYDRIGDQIWGLYWERRNELQGMGES